MDPLISLLIWLLIFAVVLYIVWIILGMMPIPPQFRTIAVLIIGLIALIILLRRLELLALLIPAPLIGGPA